MTGRLDLTGVVDKTHRKKAEICISNRYAIITLNWLGAFETWQHNWLPNNRLISSWVNKFNSSGCWLIWNKGIETFATFKANYNAASVVHLSMIGVVCFRAGSWKTLSHFIQPDYFSQFRNIETQWLSFPKFTYFWPTSVICRKNLYQPLYVVGQLLTTLWSFTHTSYIQK